MVEDYEFELIFALPQGAQDAFALSDAVFEAGFEDALVGTGVTGLLAVALEAAGEDAESVILGAARALIRTLPAGTTMREVRPDLVSLADVAEKLEVKRQALQQRKMPLPVAGGLYRIDELRDALEAAASPQPGRRRPRFNMTRAAKWFRAGPAARRLNAQLTMQELDPVTIERKSRPQRDEALVIHQ